MTDRRRLPYREYGAGAPIVVLHGLFGSARNWQSVARELSRWYRVLVCDQRNHGDAPRAPAMDYAVMAADVAELLDALALPVATLLGHSMGGKVAMALALREPARLERLIVVDIAPVARADRFGAIVAALRALPLSSLATRAAADAALAGAIADPALRAFLLHNLARTDCGWRWQVDLDAIAGNLEHILDFPAPPPAARFTGPALFLRGARSDAVLPEHAELIYRWFPAARIETIEGAGHWPHAERREEFLARVVAFLAGT